MGKAMIDVQKGELTLRLNSESVTFSIYDAMKRHDEDGGGRIEHCSVVQVTKECVRAVTQVIFLPDQLEKCLSQSIYFSYLMNTSEFDFKFCEFAGALDSALEIPRSRHQKFLPLRNEKEDGKEAEVEKKLELKPLPSNLQYAYLGDNETMLVIVSSSLSNAELDKLLKVLRKHKGAIGGPSRTSRGLARQFACIGSY